jgi:hypothetical protein
LLVVVVVVLQRKKVSYHGPPNHRSAHLTHPTFTFRSLRSIVIKQELDNPLTTSLASCTSKSTSPLLKLQQSNETDKKAQKGQGPHTTVLLT